MFGIFALHFSRPDQELVGGPHGKDPAHSGHHLEEHGSSLVLNQKAFEQPQCKYIQSYTVYIYSCMYVLYILYVYVQEIDFYS